MLYGYVTVYLVVDEPQLNVSHRLSRRLNNATGQCPGRVSANDGTVARGVWTYRYPVVCPVVPSCRRFLDQPNGNSELGTPRAAGYRRKIN